MQAEQGNGTPKETPIASSPRLPTSSRPKTPIASDTKKASSVRVCSPADISLLESVFTPLGTHTFVPSFRLIQSGFLHVWKAIRCSPCHNHLLWYMVCPQTESQPDVMESPKEIAKSPKFANLQPALPKGKRHQIPPDEEIEGMIHEDPESGFSVFLKKRTKVHTHPQRKSCNLIGTLQ